MNFRPLPSTHGVGLTSDEPLPKEVISGYRYEQVGRYHNYHATAEGWRWPNDQIDLQLPSVRIDGFSPNLNKELHVGHLRNLAIANSLNKILPYKSCQPVALFGASLGVKKKALEGLEYWLNFVEYYPDRYYDVLMPLDVIETRKPTEEEVVSGKIGSTNVGFHPDLWDGPNGPVVVNRSDGRPLYAHYDLIFAKEVAPTHYITGAEQREHFASLGLSGKHLVMGLVLGEDGKKIKSRTGDALSAIEAVECIEAKLDPTDEPRKVAWNVLAWNFLQCKREQNLKFDETVWTRPEAPGMYITYTCARTLSALAKTRYSMKERASCENWLSNPIGGLADDSEAIDVELAAFASQYDYWYRLAVQKLDPSPIAHYAHDLARKMGNAYHKAAIVDGRPSFIIAVQYANETLRLAMEHLGMFRLARV